MMNRSHSFSSWLVGKRFRRTRSSHVFSREAQGKASEEQPGPASTSSFACATSQPDTVLSKPEIVKHTCSLAVDTLKVRWRRGEGARVFAVNARGQARLLRVMALVSRTRCQSGCAPSSVRGEHSAIPPRRLEEGLNSALEMAALWGFPPLARPVRCFDFSTLFIRSQCYLLDVVQSATPTNVSTVFGCGKTRP